MLSNRIAVLLGKNDAEVVGIHDKMLDFYRYRSESLHEGDGSNISKQDSLKWKIMFVRLLLQLCRNLNVSSLSTIRKRGLILRTT